MRGNTNNILEPGEVDSTYMAQYIWNAYGGTILTILSIVLVVALLAYILQSIGLMKIAQKCELKHSWLAWVPVVNLYTMGRVAFDSKGKAIAFFLLPTIVFPVGILARLLSIDLGTVSLLCQIAAGILNYYVIYKIYKRMSDRAPAMLFFSVLSGGLLTSIFIFAIRNNMILSRSTDNA